MFKNILLSCAAATILAVPSVTSACPRTSPAQALPLGIASSDTSKVTFSLSNKGELTIRRTLTQGVPAEAVSCSVDLEGRYSRNLSYTGTKLLGTQSSLSTLVSFRAKRLPSVKPDVFRKQTVQPTLHVRVKTTCFDKDGGTILTDTTPVVARYVECGYSIRPVSMAKFINTLTQRLDKD